MTQPQDPFFDVLCVDDDSQMRQALQLGLQAYGFNVILAESGSHALKELASRQGKLNAIITDNAMPEMNGRELAHAVRGAGFKGRLVVISGGLTPEDLHAYGPYNISGFFQKPFETSLLATMLLQAD